MKKTAVFADGKATPDLQDLPHWNMKKIKQTV